MGFVEELLKLSSVIRGMGAGDKDVADALVEGYEKEVEKFRPIIKSAPRIVSKALSDLVPVLDDLTETLIRDHGSRLAIITQRLNDISARGTMRKLLSYTKAGFSREEALDLVKYDRQLRLEALKGSKK